MSDAALKKKAAQIKLLVLDVDGTLTDGGVYIDSNGVQSPATASAGWSGAA